MDINIKERRRMKKKIWAAVICGIIALLAAAGCILLYKKPHADTVLILQDGRELYRLELSRTENKTINIEYNGKINTVEIRNHKIRMLDADCPDHTCVHMGYLESAPIICLPNRLVIQFADEE